VKALKKLLLIFSLSLFGQSAVAVCNDGKSTLQFEASSGASTGDYVVGFTPSLMPITVGKHFSVNFEICALNGNSPPTIIKIDADMPAHKHGMNYKPTVSQTSTGYVANGLMFHMPGVWRLTFELANNDSTSPSVRVFRELRIE
jgi:hypothetical protein